MSQSSRLKVETLLPGFGMFAKLSGFQMLKPIGGAQTKSATALVWYFSNIQPETREQNGQDTSSYLQHTLKYCTSLHITSL
jgi:hypothetical protein